MSVLSHGHVEAQPVQPYVDHWDSLKTIKRSEGLYVNGLEWGEWSYWDRSGKLLEISSQAGGMLHGRTRKYYANGQVQHDGWFRKGKQDSIMTSYYASGQVMESGWYKKGMKDSTWHYFFADGKPLLNEVWNDSLVIVTDAWDKDGSRTLTKGDGLVRAYFPSGAKQEETAYAVGVKSGASTLFYP
ncbi:MAG: hypothetical protein KA941_12075, partial [Flavobacteriales bacterium]|nr:hypothetical protein [Flavobacteriales bacterium]